MSRNADIGWKTHKLESEKRRRNINGLCIQYEIRLDREELCRTTDHTLVLGLMFRRLKGTVLRRSVIDRLQFTTMKENR